MKDPLQSTLIPSVRITSAVLKILLLLMLAAGATCSVRAQGELASGTVSGSGSSPYDYVLTFSDAAGATSPIGSVWYAWIPGFWYLPSAPTSASAPAGWSAAVNSGGGGSSIQFVASSSAYYISPGQTLSGFSYMATFSPAQLAAAPSSGSSFAYKAGLFSDNGQNFNVQAVPEPSTLGLFLFGATALSLMARRKLA